MEQTKDYSLLRPFDIEAAKAGEKICYGEDGDYKSVTFIAEAGPDGDHSIRDHNGNCYTEPSYGLRMAPLCWVEGKPVYKGDVLYSDKHGKGVIVDASNFNGGYAIEFERTKISIEATYFNSGLTWTTPKVKRDGWVNVYFAQESVACLSDAWPTKEKCDALQRQGRIACVRIEWEE